MPGKRLTKEQKTQIISLCNEGKSVPEIARILEVDAQRAAGVVASAKNRGLVRRDAEIRSVGDDRPKVVDPGFQPVPTAAPPPAPTSPQPSASAQTPLQAGDPYLWSQNPTSSGYGAPMTTYQVERLIPKDGLLGTHNSSPSDDEVGRLYGQGTYRIARFENGRHPVYRELVIAESYGAPRFPRASGVSTSGGRASGFLNRLRMRDAEEDDAPPRRPYMPTQAAYRSPEDSSLSQFARHTDSVAVAAVEALGKIHDRTLQQMDQDRQSGPQQFMTKFFEKNQDYQEKVRERERQKDEDRLEAERRRREDERKEEEVRWQRRQAEQDAAHKRELERAAKEAEYREKLERERYQNLLDIHDKRAVLIREEAKADRERLTAELERSRQEAKADRDAMLKQIAEMNQKAEERISEIQESVQEELKRERDGLKKEHTLREQALSNEHSLKREMLALEKKIHEGATGDGMTSLFSKVGEGIERVIKEIVELKKIQALSPEAQAAQVVGSGANVQEAPPREDAPAAQPSMGESGGNGHQASPPVSQPQQQGVSSMEDMVRKAAQNSYEFRQILKEWANNVKAGAKPQLFANLFLDWMRMEGPEGAPLRNACSTFATIIGIRDWSQMIELLRDGMPQDLRPVFESEYADEFYEGFRAIVVSSIEDYYESYMAEKLKRRAAASAPKEEEAAQRT